MHTENKLFPLKTGIALSAILLIMLGIGFATGIVPGSNSMNDEARADRECENCGVIENIKIAILSDKQREFRDSMHNTAGSGNATNPKQAAHFVITVRMNNGERKTLAQAVAPRFKSGQKVKIENDTLLAGYY